MKKAVFLLTTAALTACISVGAFAQAPEKLMVNGEEINLDGYQLMEENGQYIVPLRPTAEALGFEIKWDAASNAVEIDNQSVKSKITVGQDSYYKQSSNAIGLTQAISLGTAPFIVDDRTYIPLDFYELLISNEDATYVEDGVIFINEVSNAQIPNPMIPFDTLEEAQEAVGFTAPSLQLPEGYTLNQFYVIDRSLLDLRYQKDGQEILLRMSRGSGDNSGIYTSFEQEKTVGEATLKGNQDTWFLALLEKDGFTYSIYAKDGMSEAELVAAVESL